MPSATLDILQVPAPARPTFSDMLAEDGHHAPAAFLYGTGRLFTGVQLHGARALEIGSGKGLQAIYMARHGAHVTSLEPESVGSTSGVIALQRSRCASLRLDVEIVAADFNTWETDRQFDVILSRASINHLCPTTHHALYDRDTRVGYVTMLRRVHDRLAPGGVFIATDASRYAFFLLARKYLTRPWDRRRFGVNWRHHQTPYTWRRLMREAGFRRVEIDYYVPYPLRGLAPLLRNHLAAFCHEGAFILRAHR